MLIYIVHRHETCNVIGNRNIVNDCVKLLRPITRSRKLYGPAVGRHLEIFSG